MLPSDSPFELRMKYLEETEEKEESAEHAELRERLRKTLYYGKIPNLDRPSLAMTELAVEFLQDLSPKELGKIDMYWASALSRDVSVSPCALMLALMYVKQLKHRNSQYLLQVSSSDIFLISMLVASKYLYDEGEEGEVSNNQWANLANMDVADVSAYERSFLSAIDWNVFVKPEDFWNALHQMERKVAWKMALQRNWFTYTDLFVILSDKRLVQRLCAILAEVFKVVTVCTIAYSACVTTMFLSSVAYTAVSTSSPAFVPSFLSVIVSPNLTEKISLSQSCLPFVAEQVPCTDPACFDPKEKEQVPCTTHTCLDPKEKEQVPYTNPACFDPKEKEQVPYTNPACFDPKEKEQVPYTTTTCRDPKEKEQVPCSTHTCLDPKEKEQVAHTTTAYLDPADICHPRSSRWNPRACIRFSACVTVAFLNEIIVSTLALSTESTDDRPTECTLCQRERSDNNDRVSGWHDSHATSNANLSDDLRRVHNGGAGAPPFNFHLREVPDAKKPSRHDRCPLCLFSSAYGDVQSDEQKRMYPWQKRMCPQQKRMCPHQKRMYPHQERMCPHQKRMCPHQERMYPWQKRTCPVDERSTADDYVGEIASPLIHRLKVSLNTFNHSLIYSNYFLFADPSLKTAQVFG